MKKHLLTAVAVLICSVAAVSNVCGQTATFSFNDGNGTPDAGSYTPGSSFTFSITLNFTAGGTISNLEGVSYYFSQTNPASAPYNFAITNRDVTGSQFTSLQTPSLTYPQSLNPTNANDLGAALQSTTGTGNGSYFIANITMSIDPSALPGTYVLSTLTTGGKRAVISDSAGHTFVIPQTSYTVTVTPVAVPEPATVLAGVLALVGLAAYARRSFHIARSAAV